MLYLLDVDNLATMALDAAVLPSHPVDKAFRSLGTILQSLDGSGAAYGLRSMPRRDP